MVGAVRGKYLRVFVYFTYFYAAAVVTVWGLGQLGVLSSGLTPLAVGAVLLPVLYHVSLLRSVRRVFGQIVAYMALLALLNMAMFVVSDGTGEFTSPNNGIILLVMFFAALLGVWMPVVLLWMQFMGLLAHFSTTGSTDDLPIGALLLAAYGLAAVTGWFVWRRFYAKADPALERLRHALQAERLQSEAVIASINDGVTILNRDGVVRHVNAPFLKMFALEYDELIGKHYEQVVTTRVKIIHTNVASPRLGPNIRKVFETGEPATIDSVTAAYEDGRPSIDASMSVMPLKNDDGEISAVMIFVRDITNIMRLQRMKDQLISTASHELRTPITVISGYADLLLNASFGELNDKQRQYVMRTKETAGQMTRLVNDMLDISRLESGERVNEPERIALDPYIRTVTEESRLKFEDKQLTVTAQSEPAEVIVDQSRLRQAFDLLLGNAYKFTPSGGAITIDCTVRGDVAMVTIADTGPGIPEDKREAVFERFTKVDVSGAIAGTGLGLPIVRKLVEDWGGSVHAEAADEGGAKFVLTIPLAARQEDSGR